MGKRIDKKLLELGEPENSKQGIAEVEEKIRLGKRWKSKSPKLFKRITNFCIGLGAIGGAIALSPIALPAAVVGLSGYLITAGIIGGAVSKLTVKK